MAEKSEASRQLVNRYAWILSQAREKARELGYALAVHGSEERDLDLIAAPWTEEAVSGEELAHAVAIATGGRLLVRPDPQVKPHGRLAWTITFEGPPWPESCGCPFIDLSVMPTLRERSERALEGAPEVVREALLPPTQES